MAVVLLCTMKVFVLLLASGSITSYAVKACAADHLEDAKGSLLLQAKHPQVQVSQDPDSLKWRETALDQQLSKVHKPTGSCGWVVHYDRWITTFDKGEFEHNDRLGGAHCLDACCEDPSCSGLALESSEKYKCYKYSNVPANLDASKAVRLGNAEWILRKPQAWSIFIKANPGSELWQKAQPTPLPDARSLRDFSGPETVVAPEATMPHKNCDWDVYYDRWMPSFDQKEYEHNDAYGGKHCLEACCQDPTCQGLSLESSEMFQCYKYSSLPPALEAQSKGVAKKLDKLPQRLGDGKWLLEKPAKWSIFVKRVEAAPVKAAAKDTDELMSQEPRALKFEAASEKFAARSTGGPVGVTSPLESALHHTQTSKMQAVRNMLAGHTVNRYWSVGALATVAVVALYVISVSDNRSAKQLMYSLKGSTELKMLLKK